MKKHIRMLNAAWIKWAVIPLLTFLLAGWVTRKVVSARQPPGSASFQTTVAASLKKLDSGDHAGAVSGLARAQEIAPGNLAQQMCLIPKFIALGESKLAAQAMEHALRAAPGEQQTAGSYTGLCQYLLENNDLAGAKRILTGDLMARWPDAPETACFQGEVALKSATGKDDLAAAVGLLQKCLAQTPDYMPARTQLGIAYALQGEWHKAEPLLRSVLEQQPFDAAALAQLGEVLRQVGKTAEATTYLDESKRVGNLRDRQKEIESEYELNTCQPKDLLELGRIYEQLGEFNRAVSTLRVYTKLQPTDADGQRELDRVRLKLDVRTNARKVKKIES